LNCSLFTATRSTSLLTLRALFLWSGPSFIVGSKVADKIVLRRDLLQRLDKLLVLTIRTSEHPGNAPGHGVNSILKFASYRSE
jgi:hypothetical protein